MSGSDDIRQRTRSVYERRAEAWDRERGRSLFERPWLDRLLARTAPGDTILDIGCGSGEPVARYVLECGRQVCGVDFARPMLEIARSRFPSSRWIEADMRDLDLGETFAGVIAWDSFFHLSMAEQAAVIPRLARHVAPGGGLLLTVGPREGEAIGTVGGEPVYHASLAPHDYAERLRREGLTVSDFVPEDPACGGHSVLLAGSPIP